MNNKIEWAELLGMLLSDGSVYSSKSSGTYRVGVVNNSEIWHEKFKQLSCILFDVTKFSYDKSIARVPITYFCSKSIALKIQSLINSARTSSFERCNGKCCFRCLPFRSNEKFYTTIKFPNFLSKDSETQSAFLRALYSGDGSVLLGFRKDKKKVKIARKVSLHCCHPLLAKQVKSLLEDLGFSQISITDESVDIFQKSEIKRFSKLINFWPIEVTGYWSKWNLTKPEVLQLLVWRC